MYEINNNTSFSYYYLQGEKITIQMKFITELILKIKYEQHK